MIAGTSVCMRAGMRIARSVGAVSPACSLQGKAMNCDVGSVCVVSAAVQPSSEVVKSPTYTNARTKQVVPPRFCNDLQYKG